jgi:prepilin-type N-terminal cleavage/methylation domain-containing protein
MLQKFIYCSQSITLYNPKHGQARRHFHLNSFRHFRSHPPGTKAYPMRTYASPRSFAFTLVELLVVIAIIALLTSMLAPSLSAARSVARNTVCQTKVRSYITGILTYTTDNQDRFPTATSTSNLAAFAATTGSSPILVADYLSVPKRTVAQMAVPAGWSTTYNSGAANVALSMSWVPGPLACPEIPPTAITDSWRPVFTQFYPSYCMNGNLALFVPAWQNTTPVRNGRLLNGRPVSVVKRPSHLVATYEWGNLNYLSGPVFQVLPEDEGNAANAGTAAPGWRHFPGAVATNSASGTLSYLDGHVISESATRQTARVLQEGTSAWYLK